MTNLERILAAFLTAAVLALGYAALKDDAYTIDKRERAAQSSMQSCASIGGIIHLDKEMKFIGCDVQVQQRQ